ncbi:hypothetical protein ES703_11797 [subsurface metagenome]
MKKVVDTTCPECQKLFQTEVDIPDAPTLDQIHGTITEALKGRQGISSDEVKQLLQEQLSPLTPKEDHRHKTADELFDCPECSDWIAKTSQKHKVSPIEEEPTEQPPIGSIFGRKTGE